MAFCACLILAEQGKVYLPWFVSQQVNSHHRKLSYFIRIIDFEIYLQHEWRAHEYEAWICAFDNWLPHVLFSGTRTILLTRSLRVRFLLSLAY
jgi:hypothetical protein